MSEIDTALVARMEKLVWNMSAGVSRLGISGAYNEADAIVALLPEPVDPDLIEARKMAHAAYPNAATTDFVDGKADNSIFVAWRLEGIKRGRELEREGK